VKTAGDGLLAAISLLVDQRLAMTQLAPADAQDQVAV